ncbi:MAG: hypothetical protein ONB05_05295, partial [candidate division KSB1 bacterium]|nr:hypothetical protein [candidate division KSB1 bacterium]
MIENFLYKCPLCLKEDALKTEDRCRCTNCAAQFERVGRNIKVNGQIFACSQLYQKIKQVSLEALPTNELNLAPGEVLYKESKRALLRQGRQGVPYHGFGGIFSILEILEKIDEGRFYITNRNFFFKGNNGLKKFPLEHITCVTTDSQDFVFKFRGQPYFHIRFMEESPLKYEDIAREVLRTFWKGKHIVEFQPRIVFADQKKTWRKRTKDLIPTDKGSLKVRFLDTMVFAIIKTLAYPVFRYY